MLWFKIKDKLMWELGRDSRFQLSTDLPVMQEILIMIKTLLLSSHLDSTELPNLYCLLANLRRLSDKILNPQNKQSGFFLRFSNLARSQNWQTVLILQIKKLSIVLLRSAKHPLSFFRLSQIKGTGTTDYYWKG